MPFGVCHTVERSIHQPLGTELAQFIVGQLLCFCDILLRPVRSLGSFSLAGSQLALGVRPPRLAYAPSIDVPLCSFPWYKIIWSGITVVRFWNEARL
jgi:hypothetical protein